MFPELNDIPQMVQGILTPLKVSQLDVIPLCYLFSLPFQLSSFDHRSQHRPALIIRRMIMTKANGNLRLGGRKRVIQGKLLLYGDADLLNLFPVCS